MKKKGLERDVSLMRCFCGARLIWIEKGRRLKCPVEGVVYEIPSERTGYVGYGKTEQR